MRTIERSTAFKRDFKRVKKGILGPHVDDLVREVVVMLVADVALPPKFRDHGLTGKLKQYRECHLRPDLLLMYELPDGDTLKLVRLGSHSELFG
jgi:mRNA interferase YafQ